MNNQQQHFLTSVLHGKREISEEEAQIRAGHLQMAYLLCPPFLVAEVAPYYTGVKPEEKDAMIQECAEYVEKRLQEAELNIYYTINDYDNIQILIARVAPEGLSALEETFIDIRNKLQLFFGLDSFIGIGSLVNKIADISDSAQDAAEMLAYKYTYAEQGVANIRNLIRFVHSPNYSSNIRFDRVIGCFQDGNIGRMVQRLDELISDIRVRPNVSHTAIKRTFIELTVSVLHVASNADVDTSDFLQGLDIYRWILEQQHTDILTEWFIKLCEELRIAMQQKLDSAEMGVVQSACVYIEGHIGEQSLSLVSVSEAIGLSSSYFSKLFKQEKGIGLNNYITIARIEQAKRLLEETALPLVDVALQSGFSTAGYFSQVFRKNTGLTPGEYRQKLKKEQNFAVE